MSAPTTQQLLDAAADWFRDTIIVKHKQGAREFLRESRLNINPFTVHYLAKVVGTGADPLSIARALLYPRILGTSINTSFGTNFQKFITSQFANAEGSVVEGMDIEFVDHLDGRRKFSQIKLGVETINHDDVKTIVDKFKHLLRFARTNGLEVRQEDLIVGVLTGQEGALNNNYRKIRADGWRIEVGGGFWERLTGEPRTMDLLVESMRLAAVNYVDDGWLDDLVLELSRKPFIVQLSNIVKPTGT
jgi:hypothetical protein